ncbi:MAG: MATE family efflux transporter [Clostridia bacterium]|nr:MATE family efflux transporter [Clostridia bacterium]
MSFIKRYVGDRKFYLEVVATAVPIMIQMGITNFVNLLDNIMVGSLGTESMSGVSIVNQFVFIFNLLVFGAVSAAGIFTAQFHGKGDDTSVRATFRFKLIVNLAVGVLGVLVFYVFSDVLVKLFLHDDGTGADLQLVFQEAKSYLLYILIGLVPYSVSQAYASTLRECERTVLPMVSSIASVVTNFVLNLILIFGLLGFPALGVAGAAIATSISRVVELLILVVWTHTHTGRYTFARGLYRSLRIPGELTVRIIKKGMPIIINECMWSVAITVRNQCYSTRGVTALAASSVASTVFNVFSVVYLSMGSAIAIMVGTRLGAGEIEKARDTSRKMIAFSVFAAAVIGCMLLSVTPFLPKLFDVDADVQSLATYMLSVQCILMPIFAFANTSYYTIRSGGKVLITMLMDSGFMWACVVPVSAILAYATGMDIYFLYPICQATDILKVALGAILLKKYNWARRVV